MKLVFATNNKHKLEEINLLLGHAHEIISLSDINCHVDIPEEQDTLEGNALQKAKYIKEYFGYDCFADDTGLEVQAINNEPGVYSARYAGPAKDAQDNMSKILTKLNGCENRQACFRTVIALLLDGKEYLFEGRVDGQILLSQQGNDGFGYDPIFQPDGFQESFAEMSMSEKNKISHRGRATTKLCDFLNSKDEPRTL